jgi:hypothetical protein
LKEITMRVKVLRGFCLGGGKDVFPGEVAEIPPQLESRVPVWQAQGKLGELVDGQPIMVHKGFGRYDVLDADGNVVKTGIKKAEAEKELAWLTNEE